MPGVRPSESPGLWKTTGQHRDPEQQTTRQVARRQSTIQRQWATSGLLTFLFMVITQLSGFAQTTVNLSLSTVVSNKKPAIGDAISYTLTLNNAGPQSSTNVTVQVKLPTGGITVGTPGAGFTSGPANTTTGITTGTWTVGTLANGGKATLIINATVQAEGVFFVESEVQTASGIDANSSPGNGSYIEDDYANVCFSVPLTWYPGEEYTVTVPSAFTGTMWMVNGVALTPALSATAEVNSSGELVIKQPGRFSFTSQVGASGCAAGNCCDIEVVPGPVSSLGNFVFSDTNGNGVQDSGEPGVPGVTVILYTVSSSTGASGSGVFSQSTITTAGSSTATGNYSFTGLAPGCYEVQFVLTSGQSATSTFTQTGQGNATNDSNANPSTGLSGVVCLTAGENNPTIDAGAVPVSALMVRSQTVCAGQSATLVAMGCAGTVQWSSASGPGSTLVINTAGLSSISSTTVLSYTATCTLGGTTTSVVGTVTVNPQPSLTLSALPSQTVVAGTTVTLSASGCTAGTVNWSTGQVAMNSVAVIPTVGANTYSATCTTPAGCSSAAAITITGLQPNSLVVTNTTVCAGQPGTIMAMGCTGTVTWTGGASPVSGTALTVSTAGLTGILSTTVLSYTATCTNGQTTTAVGTVTVNPLPVATLTSASICPGESATLTAGGGTMYNFGNGFTPANTLVVSPTATAGYSVTVMTATGCVASATGTVTVLPTPSVTLTAAPSGTVLAGTSVNLTASGCTGGTLAWSINGVSGTTTTVIPTAPVNVYSVTCTTGGRCTAVSTVTIVTTQPQLGSLGNFVFQDTNGNGIQDAGEPGVPGVTVILYTVSSSTAASGTGIFSQSVLTNAGSSTATSNYSFTGLAAGCYEVQFVLSGSQSATSVFTQTGQGNAGNDSNASMNGLTGVVCLSAGENNPTIDAGIIPSTSLVVTNATVCAGQPTAIAAMGCPGTLTWNTGAAGSPLQVSTASLSAITQTVIQSYTATCVFSGITTSAVGTVTVLPRPMATLTSASICPGESATLVAGGGPDYNFGSGLSATNTLVVSPMTNTGYSVTVVTPTGCVASATGTVTVLPTPSVTLTAAPSGTVLAGTSVNLTASGCTGGTLAWSINGVSGTTTTVIPTAPVNVYSVTCTTGGRCTAVSTVTIITTTPAVCPTLTIVPNTSTTICEGGSALLTATSSTSGTISWFLTPTGGTAFTTTASGQALVADFTNTLTYYAQAADGCPRVPVTVIVERQPATPTCPERLTVCNGNIGVITINLLDAQPAIALPTGYAYEWRTGLLPTSSLVQNVTAVGVGKYYLFVRSRLGCYSFPSILTVEGVSCECKNQPTIAVGPGKSICEGETVSLSAVLGGSATSLAWTTSGTGVFSTTSGVTTVYTPSAADRLAGLVTISARTNDPDGTGVCVAATSSLVVQINERPDAPIGVACDDVVLCQGFTTKLVGFAPDAVKINWYDQNGQFLGFTDAKGGKLTITPMMSGTVTYFAEAVSEDGCVSSTRSSVTIVVRACLADLGVEKQVTPTGPYKVGQTISYVIRAFNNGPVSASNVTVMDALPSQLAFVSASPNGVYNAATNTWTIGNLTTTGSGASALLTIQAKIIGTGTVKNVAVITGTNDDPTKPENNTSTVTIEVPTCDVIVPPHITCTLTEICKGYSTTLRATECKGTVLWSNGRTGATIDVFPIMTTTYTATCISGACASLASNAITVTVLDPKQPVITASANSVCIGGSVSLTATGCVGGTYKWSTGATTPVITVSPTTRTNYTVNCLIGNCPSAPAEKLIEIGSDLPKPTVTCSSSVVCPGESLELTANCTTGMPMWSNGATTNRITVTPTVGNNSYFVTCKSGACTSPQSENYVITIKAPRVPTVTPNSATICPGGSVTLTASGCEDGTIVWNNGTTNNSLVVRPTASQGYTAQCKFRTCISNASIPTQVVVTTPGTPIVDFPTKTSICSGESLTLTASGCGAASTVWSDGQTGTSIRIMPTTRTVYSAQCVAGSCRSDVSNKITINVNTNGTAPTIAASKTAICAGESVTLTASNCPTGGTVVWSDVAMTNGSTLVVMPTAATMHYFAICKQSDKCGSPKSNTIGFSITPIPTPTVTCSETAVCPGEKVTLIAENCAGVPMWSTGETTTMIDVRPTVTTTYTVTCVIGACKSAGSQNYTIQIIRIAAPTIAASKTLIETGESVSLTATGCTDGTIVWSNGSTGNVIMVQPTATQSYFANCIVRTCPVDPSITITIVVNGGCQAKAGALRTDNPVVCAGGATSVVLTAVPNGGKVVPAGYSTLYVLTQGTDLVIQQVSATPSFSVAATPGEYTLHTLVYNANPSDPNFLDLSGVVLGTTKASAVLNVISTRKLCADLDAAGVKVTVKSVAPPTIFGSPSQTVCLGTTVSLSAIGCAGGTVIWSNGFTGNPLVVTAVTEDIRQMATCTIDGCTSEPSASYDVVVIIPTNPTISASKLSVCLPESVTLTATGCRAGYVEWSNGTTGSTIVVTPTASANTYKARCVVPGCPSEFSPNTTIAVGPPSAPTAGIVSGTATVSSTTICFGATVQLVATGCPTGSYVTWSNNSVGHTITVSPAVTDTYTARCCTSDNCKSDPSPVLTVTVLPKVAQPKIKDLTNVCPIITVDLTTGITSAASAGGMFEFYTSSTLDPATKVSNPNAVGKGIYYVVEKSASGCLSLPATINVNITDCGGTPTPCNTNPATANAGADNNICAAKTYKLAGTLGGGAVTGKWTTSGTGTFSDPFAPDATYTASEADVLAGKVVLTLTGSTNNPVCPTAADNLTLTIGGVAPTPTITPKGSLIVCAGGSVTLEASQAASYLWNTKATTRTISVTASGVYTVQTLNAQGCSSLPSASITVTVGAPIAAPIVSNLRNICPEGKVDLTRAPVMTLPEGSTYEYYIDETRQFIVTTPREVCEDEYYVFIRTREGCYSDPSMVIVKDFYCPADKDRADLSITKTASASAVGRGQAVTYTVTVTNNGPDAARNVDIRDILPAGLDLQIGSTALDFDFANGMITKSIHSLSANQSVTISYSAKLTQPGTVTNTAEIAYSDVVDPNTANNKASATVTNTATVKPGMIGIAKNALTTLNNDGTFTASFQFRLTNYGDTKLTNVQVMDDLTTVFGSHTVTSVSVQQALGGTGYSLVPNAAYTGTGSNVNLLNAANSSIEAGSTGLLALTVNGMVNPADASRAFSNSAMASALSGTATTEDASVAGADADPDNDDDPTNNAGPTNFTLAQPQAVPGIGVALAAKSVEKQPDGTVTVVYEATVKNFGNKPLNDVQLTNDLTKTFTAPATFTVLGTSSSTFGANALFNGSSVTTLLGPGNTLAAGATGTVTILVSVMPNGATGPFYNSIIASGTPESTSVVLQDVSNTGYDPTPAGETPTAVRFDLPNALLGVAKLVGTPMSVSGVDGQYDIPYTISVTNFGTEDLTDLQVTDDLSAAFNGAGIISTTLAVQTSGTGLTGNPNYTGQGMLTNLLSGTANTLAKGQTATLSFTVRVDVSSASSLTFNNTAIATAQAGTAVTSDTSTSGTNPDPTNTLDPRLSNDPTPVTLNNANAVPFIGLAMTVKDTVRQADGSYNVTYIIVVKNYAGVMLSNVVLTDSLAGVFRDQDGATFKVVGTQVAGNGSGLRVNPDFNGSTDSRLTLGASSSLAAGRVDTLYLVVNVSSTGVKETFLNSAVATAQAGTTKVSDISTNGVNPDVNGNRNPTDSNEGEATPLTLLAGEVNVFIPEGFSPNGDNINDRFVIRGAQTQTVSMEIYNRWGLVVYKNDDYKNDWDGTANTGVNVGASTAGLPEGTYFYRVKLSDGKVYVRYMTINR